MLPSQLPNNDINDQTDGNSELRFQTLFEQAPFSVQLLGLDGRTLRVNKAWEALWQVAEDTELKKYVLSEYNMLEDRQLEAKGVTAVLRRAFAGESVTLPTILYDPTELGKPGNPRWVAAYAHPIKTKHGLVREVMLIHEDVTSRIEHERALQKSEERLQEGLAAGRLVVWEWNLQTQEIEYSRNAMEVMGYDVKDVAEGWRHVHPDDVERLTMAINRAIEERGSFHELTRRIRPDNGKIVWVDNHGKITVDNQGRPVSVRAINMDVTERVQAELELKEANRRKDDFLAMLAHELRNPLAPISTAAQLLKIGSHDEKIRHQACEIISRQAKHMTDLVDDLLDVSRVTRGLVQLDRQYLDLKTIVSNAIEQARPLIEARRHILTTWIGSDHVCVNGDHTRLVQVIVNLLNNAAKYTPQGGEIALRLEASNGQAKIVIKDSGAGIDADLLPRVFELFTQAARSPDRSQGGLGIGLALVKNIVALHDGQVKAHSDGAGKGSTFTVTLPIARREAVCAVMPDGAPIGTALPQRIMVVDDNQDSGNMLGALLKARGHQVTVKTHPQTALADAVKEVPHVFILDIGLPGMDGYELARRLRAQSGLERAIFIALTGYGQAHDKVLSKQAGFNHHFVKPLDVDSLEAVLCQLQGNEAAT